MKTLLVIILASLVIGLKAQLNLQWQQLGPDNFGAPVRAMIIDNRDTTQQTLYAGVMGGGIWKSINGGDWWTYLGCAGNYGVSCMAQAASGIIYFGTGNFSGSGDGLSTEHGGNGIYLIDATDNIIHLDSANILKPVNDWFAINRIAINPLNDDHLLVAGTSGLFQSLDAGKNWNQIVIPGANGGAMDVKWSTDSVVYAVLGGYKVLVRSTDYGSSWTRISSVDNPGFPPVKGRIEVALDLFNSSIAYVSVAQMQGATYGVFSTFNRGSTWDTVTLKNASFDPFGLNNEGWMDNAIAVMPFDSSKIIVAGYAAYTITNSGTITQIPTLGNGTVSGTDNLLVNGFVISKLKPEVIYCYGHRGVFKCFNAQTDWPNPIFNVKYGGMYRDFNSVAAKLNGEVWGSSHFVGLISYNPLTQQFEKKSNNRSLCDVSTLAPNVIISSNWAGQLQTSLDGGQTFFIKQDLNLDPQGQGDPSRCGYVFTGNAPYIACLRIAETTGAYNSVDSINYVAPSAKNPGDTLWVSSNTASKVFPYLAPHGLLAGEVLKIPDAVQSRLFLASNCGIWMKRHALDTIGSKDWFLISSSNLGVATSFSTSDDGNTLYAGTLNGRVIKVEGLNRFKGSANWNVVDSFTVTVDTLMGNHQPVQGIALDPRNAQNIVAVTAAFPAFNSDSNVFVTHNGGQTWNRIQLGDNENPAYTCLYDAGNSNNIIIGTEHGIFTSTDGGASFSPDNGNMCDVPIYSLRQAPLLADQCPVLYAATNSMGIWRSFSLTPQGCDVSIGIKQLQEGTQVHIFPNPASSQLQLHWNEEEEQALLSVYDVSGKLVLSQKISRGTATLNTSGLSNGFYCLTVVAGQQHSGAHFIISH